jgi:hypothetical protein
MRLESSFRKNVAKKISKLNDSSNNLHNALFRQKSRNSSVRSSGFERPLAKPSKDWSWPFGGDQKTNSWPLPAAAFCGYPIMIFG